MIEITPQPQVVVEMAAAVMNHDLSDETRLHTNLHVVDTTCTECGTTGGCG